MVIVGRSFGPGLPVSLFMACPISVRMSHFAGSMWIVVKLMLDVSLEWAVASTLQRQRDGVARAQTFIQTIVF